MLPVFICPPGKILIGSLPRKTGQRRGVGEKVADALDIPFINLDVRDQFYETVVQTFINQYLAGSTPNPCLFVIPG